MAVTSSLPKHIIISFTRTKKLHVNAQTAPNMYFHKSALSPQSKFTGFLPTLPKDLRFRAMLLKKTKDVGTLYEHIGGPIHYA
mmetsp:Transcript_25870/g.40962  ORF Transcript_25870/g.40962 Transcript_25870/m.40962 type:complete len:83 (-) Transcript_25870:7-255(-)